MAEIDGEAIYLVVHLGEKGQKGDKGERGNDGIVTPELLAIRDQVRQVFDKIFISSVGNNAAMTKQALREYAGSLMPIVYLTDVSIKSLAVYRPYDQSSPDNADNFINHPYIIIDGLNRRYRLMDMVELFSEFLKSYIPEEL